MGGTVTINHPNQLPPNYPEFVVCEGRYYLAHFFVDIPKNPKLPQGGNVAMLVWRYNDEETWNLTTCFRYYRDEKAYDSEDRKSWQFLAGKFAAETDLLKAMAEVLEQISGMAGLWTGKFPPQVQRMLVQGDWKKYVETAQREKPFWLHGKAVKQ